MSEKKYRLLKESISADCVIPIGTIFEEIHTCYRANYNGAMHGGFEKKLVENNPEWFEEVKEEKTAKEIAIETIRDWDRTPQHTLHAYAPTVVDNILSNLKQHGYTIVKEVEVTKEETKNLLDKLFLLREEHNWDYFAKNILENYCRKGTYDQSATYADRSVG